MKIHERPSLSYFKKEIYKADDNIQKNKTNKEETCILNIISISFIC